MARRGLGSDPLRNFKFMVTILPHSSTAIPGSIGKLGFQTVSGMSFTNGEIDYREGGDNTTPRKLPGTTSFNDVTLAQGVGGTPELGGSQYTGRELRDWGRLIFSATAGGGLNPGGVDFRAEIAIDVLAHPITSGASYAGMPRGQGNWPIKCRVVLTNAWPKGLQFGDLDAGGSGVFIQTLTIAHEGLSVYYATPGALTTYVGNTAGIGGSSSSSNTGSAGSVSGAVPAGAVAPPGAGGY
jgi:phage tail-like protein